MNAYRDQYAQLFRGGRNVVLIAISADVDTAQASWARDSEFPYLFASDTGSVLGKQFGAYLGKYKLDNRTLFVIGPDGKIATVMAPFREIDPTAYTDLAAAINKLVPGDWRPGNGTGNGTRKTGNVGGHVSRFTFPELLPPDRPLHRLLNILVRACPRVDHSPLR